MSNMIDKQKLLEWLKDEYSLAHELHNEIESGSFDLPSDQGEAARLREALHVIASIKYGMLSYSGEDAECMNRIAVEALSSRSEDTGGGPCCDLSQLTPYPVTGIHKVREWIDGVPLRLYRTGLGVNRSGVTQQVRRRECRQLSEYFVARRAMERQGSVSGASVDRGSDTRHYR